MNAKKSVVLYFSAVIMLVILCFGLKSTFAFFVATEQGTVTNIKVAKLSYKLESEALENNALTLKPNEVRKINIKLLSEYDIATVYRLSFIGNVIVQKSSTSIDDVKSIIKEKDTKDIDLVIINNTLEEQTVIFQTDGGYVGNELADGNITEVYNENLLQNKLLVDGTLTLTDSYDYRDIIGTNNYLEIDEQLYRIIGVFKENDNSYLKIITNDSIGAHMFGENNDYLTSSLNKFLNIEYKETLNKLLKNNLKEVTYYTAGLDKVIDDENLIFGEKTMGYYEHERGNLVADETFNQSGTSTIGLMYLSDYEYASLWINKNYNELTIVPNILDKTNIFGINYREEVKSIENEFGILEEKIIPINEIVSNYKVSDKYNIRPVMYLDNKLLITSGVGTFEEPYNVELDTNR